MDNQTTHEESMDDQYKNQQKMDEHNMDNRTLKGEWNQLKNTVKQKWADLTDDDLNHIEGDRDRLVGRVQERYGHSRADAERDVDEWRRENQY